MGHFTNWTEEAVARHNTRVAESAIDYKGEKPVSPPFIKPSDCTEEDDLHAQICSYCRSHGWLYFHGSMAHKAKRSAGEVDFHVYAPNGKYFAIECKTRTGKLSPDQGAVHAMAKRLGHSFFVVRSFEQFLEIVKKNEPMDLVP